MSERPILFNAPMIRAIQAGRKTQTRRFVNPQPFALPKRQGVLNELVDNPSPLWFDNRRMFSCPYGQPGDTLWVRETWGVTGKLEKVRGQVEDAIPDGMDGPFYRADGCHEDSGLRWRPSIHMPRWASRTNLTVTDIRVERLQGISEEDARAEGITDGGCLACGMSEPCGCAYPTPDARDAFINLWDSINGDKPGRSWAENPFVWIPTFERQAHV